MLWRSRFMEWRQAWRRQSGHGLEAAAAPGHGHVAPGTKKVALGPPGPSPIWWFGHQGLTTIPKTVCENQSQHIQLHFQGGRRFEPRPEVRGFNSKPPLPTPPHPTPPHPTGCRGGKRNGMGWGGVGPHGSGNPWEPKGIPWEGTLGAPSGMFFLIEVAFLEDPSETKIQNHSHEIRFEKFSMYADHAVPFCCHAVPTLKNR